VKKTIYFHVGTVKTGSTLIQKILWENKELLEEFNFHYFNLIEPKLALPRYGNAEFLLDKSITMTNDEIERYIDNQKADNIIISEEGLWANMDLLIKDIFSKYDKKIILYVRKPADVIAAWASENAEPYNALQKEHASGIGVVPIEEGVEEFTQRYIKIFENFFKNLERLKNTEVVIRAYDREQFENNDIFRDFLNILKINTNKFLEDSKCVVTKIANVSRTRKFCDISTMVFELLYKRGMKKKYSLKLVSYVYENCSSGDDRAVLETLDDRTILDIKNRLQWIEEYIEEHYLEKKVLFKNSSPTFFLSGQKRLVYQPLNSTEVEGLMEKYLIENIDDKYIN